MHDAHPHIIIRLIVLGLITVDCLKMPETSRQVCAIEECV